MSEQVPTKKWSNERSGLEPIPEAQRPCRSPEHNPPTHLHIPYGMQYRHVCPSCGAESVMRSSEAHYVV